MVIHYTLAKKGNQLSLQGDIVRPLIYAVIVTVLLIFRIKPVKSWLKKTWGSLKVRGSKRLKSETTT